jgi:hypothetical protein
MYLSSLHIPEETPMHAAANPECDLDEKQKQRSWKPADRMIGNVLRQKTVAILKCPPRPRASHPRLSLDTSVSEEIIAREESRSS